MRLQPTGRPSQLSRFAQPVDELFAQAVLDGDDPDFAFLRSLGGGNHASMIDRSHLEMV
ncbi:hypothetical protein [Dictyobacter aurantiacus]|uniref:hypothetical protein n=1 Tax=Dictyobacter aurantiacus TaxID=1936993 RepID=UPI001357F637|nr:hypothetical protein [Dictyobacter aurantiacus]